MNKEEFLLNCKNNNINIDDDNFKDNLSKIKSIHIKLKEILWLYYYLTDKKDENFENDIKEKYKKYLEDLAAEEKKKKGGKEINSDDENDDNNESESEKKSQKSESSSNNSSKSGSKSSSRSSSSNSKRSSRRSSINSAKNSDDDNSKDADDRD